MHIRERSFSLFTNILAVAAILLVLASVLLAQLTGTIQGTVTGPSNAALAAVKVSLSSQTTGAQRSTQTDAAGAFLVPDLLPDVHRMEADGEGLHTSIVKDLKLDVATAVANCGRFSVRQGKPG